MKISADIKSPDHWALSGDFTVPPEILLDGKLVEREIVEADDEAGTVTVVIMSSPNTPAYAGGKLLTEILTGKVEIRPAQ